MIQLHKSLLILSLLDLDQICKSVWETRDGPLLKYNDSQQPAIDNLRSFFAQHHNAYPEYWFYRLPDWTVGLFL